jgi:putative ABC transport system substrate-binding protein
MRNNIFCAALCAMLFALCLSAEAQQPTKKIPRVGFLSLNSASVQKHRVEAFREALRKLGYIERQNIIIDYRFADGKSERLPGLAAELVVLKVDVIVTAGNSATAPAKEATKTIPIVIMNDTDPVGQGHIDSLARPGANITGLSSTSFDLADKRLELLKEIVPKLLRVAVLRDLTNKAARRSTARSHDSAECVGKGGQDDSVRRKVYDMLLSIVSISGR